jgi:hypothetical protein
VLSKNDSIVAGNPSVVIFLLNRGSSYQFSAHFGSCASSSNDGGEDQDDLLKLARTKLTSCTANRMAGVFTLAGWSAIPGVDVESTPASVHA